MAGHQASSEGCTLLSHPFVPLLSVLILSLFLQKSPSCPSLSLLLSGLFLLYPFGDRAAGAKRGDFSVQRQTTSINGADGIIILAFVYPTASLIQPNINWDF